MIDAPVAKSLEIGIEKKGGIKLNKSALCGFNEFHILASLSKTDALGADSDCFLKNVVKSVLRQTDDDKRASNSNENQTSDFYFVNINMISTSEIRVTVIVDEGKAEVAMNAVHDAFMHVE